MLKVASPLKVEIKRAKDERIITLDKTELSPIPAQPVLGH